MKKRYIRFAGTILFLLVTVSVFSACGTGRNTLSVESAIEREAPLSETQESQSSIEADSKKEEPVGSVSEPITVAIDEKEEEKEPVIVKTETLMRYIQSDADGLNVRKGPGTNYASLGSLDKGDLVSYVGESGGFYKTYYRGREAYVSQKYAHIIEMQKTSAAVENVIGEGVKLLGTPYVYGAVRLHDGNGRMLSNFDVNKFDCSSLMQYVFYKGAKVLLQVNTRTQVKQGSEVKRSELQRGDLLFFTNASRKNKTGIERIGHVGLYLGDGYMLHTASDHAVIEKISSLRWSYFITGRRIV